jgi:hypothetical protein
MRLNRAAGGLRRAAAALLGVACALPMALPAANREAGLPLPPGLLPGVELPPRTYDLLDELRILRLRAVRPLATSTGSISAKAATASPTASSPITTSRAFVSASSSS